MHTSQAIIKAEPDVADDAPSRKLFSSRTDERRDSTSAAVMESVLHIFKQVLLYWAIQPDFPGGHRLCLEGGLQGKSAAILIFPDQKIMLKAARILIELGRAVAEVLEKLLPVSEWRDLIDEAVGSPPPQNGMRYSGGDALTAHLLSIREEFEQRLTNKSIEEAFERGMCTMAYAKQVNDPAFICATLDISQETLSSISDDSIIIGVGNVADTHHEKSAHSNIFRRTMVVPRQHIFAPYLPVSARQKNPESADALRFMTACALGVEYAAQNVIHKIYAATGLGCITPLPRVYGDMPRSSKGFVDDFMKEHMLMCNKCGKCCWSSNERDAANIDLFACSICRQAYFCSKCSDVPRSGSGMGRQRIDATQDPRTGHTPYHCGLYTVIKELFIDTHPSIEQVIRNAIAKAGAYTMSRPGSGSADATNATNAALAAVVSGAAVELISIKEECCTLDAATADATHHVAGSAGGGGGGEGLHALHLKLHDGTYSDSDNTSILAVMRVRARDGASDIIDPAPVKFSTQAVVCAVPGDLDKRGVITRMAKCYEAWSHMSSSNSSYATVRALAVTPEYLMAPVRPGIPGGGISDIPGDGIIPDNAATDAAAARKGDTGAASYKICIQMRCGPGPSYEKTISLDETSPTTVQDLLDKIADILLDYTARSYEIIRRQFPNVDVRDKIVVGPRIIEFYDARTIVVRPIVTAESRQKRKVVAAYVPRKSV